MKSFELDYEALVDKVAPFAGAWIEMFAWMRDNGYLVRVAPFAGAWIEMRFDPRRV